MTVDLRDYYTTLNECNKYIKSLPVATKKPLSKTHNDYIKTTQRMLKNGDTPLTLATTKNTYYKYRAAWAYAHAGHAKSIAAKINKETDRETKAKLIMQLKSVVDRLKQFPPDMQNKGFQRQKKGEYSSLWQTIKDKAGPGKSKKYQKFNDAQAEKYFNHILDKKSKYTDAIAVLSVTGCRPAELEKGVTLSLNPDGSIKVKILSAKTHENKYGQRIRTFSVKSDSPEFSYLADQIGNKSSMAVKVESAKNLGTQLEKYSKQVFPRMKVPITPYSYRHRFGKAIKSVLTDKTQIATALGHSNDKSQRYYSNKGKGGGFSIENITGTREVKQISSATTSPYTNNNNHTTQPNQRDSHSISSFTN